MQAETQREPFCSGESTFVTIAAFRGHVDKSQAGTKVPACDLQPFALITPQFNQPSSDDDGGEDDGSRDGTNDRHTVAHIPRAVSAYRPEPEHKPAAAHKPVQARRPLDMQPAVHAQ
jgi:hypothetical protein